MAADLAPALFTGADGLALRADVGGPPTAPPVILLHGGGQTRGSWKHGARRLVDAGYHVISLDARGHGESDWSTTGDYSNSARAADLRAVAATLSSPPAVVGASMGGLTAILALGVAPFMRAAALVLVDVTPKVDVAGAKRVIDFMRAYPAGFSSIEEASDAVSAYNPGRPRPSDPSGLRRNLRKRGARWFWHWDPRFMPDDVDPSRDTEELEAAATRINVPTLLIRGRQSDVVGDAEVRRFRELMPHAAYTDIASAGHMIAGDRNDMFNDAMVDFLAQSHPVNRE